MNIQNNIGWCDATTNGVTGCDKVSPGCKNCYAAVGTRARVLRSQGKETWGAKGQRVPVNFEPVFRRLNKLIICARCHESGVRHSTTDADLPNYQCHSCGEFALRRIRLFADSNSDWLDPKWPVETLAKFLDAIRLAPNVDVLLLTKRIENFTKRLTEAMQHNEDSGGDARAHKWMLAWCAADMPPSNVWLGVSVEDQKRADERRQHFEDIPASVKFVSFEPALEQVDWSGWDFIDWMIVGAESGKARRDCGVEVIIEAAEDCIDAGIPVYVKQDCAFRPGQQGRIPDNVWQRKEFPSQILNVPMQPAGTLQNY